MKKKSTEQYQIQVGAFLTIGILLAMTLILILGSKKTFFKPQYTLVSQFEDISGLRTGAPVQLAGVTVGYVEKISFSTNLKRKKVKVYVKVDREFQQRIRKDSEATVVTQGLLGDRMVFVSVGSVDQEILKDGDTLRAGKATGFAAIVEKTEELMNQAEKSLSHINTLVGNVNQITNEVIVGDGLVHEVIYSPQGKEFVRSMTQAARNFDAVSLNLASISGKINRGQGTLGALINEPSLYYEIRTLIGKANRNKLVRSVIRYTLKTKNKDQLQ